MDRIKTFFQNLLGKKQEKKEPPLDEVGFTGINISGGQIDWEYQKNLTSLQDRMKVYHRMLSDGSVATAIRLLELPILSQKISVIPASDDPEDLKKADFVKDQILRESNISSSYSYQDHLVEACKYFQYGFVPFEIVYEIGDWVNDDGIEKNMVKLEKKDCIGFIRSIIG